MFRIGRSDKVFWGSVHVLCRRTLQTWSNEALAICLNTFTSLLVANFEISCCHFYLKCLISSFFPNNMTSFQREQFNRKLVIKLMWSVRFKNQLLYIYFFNTKYRIKTVILFYCAGLPPLYIKQFITVCLLYSNCIISCGWCQHGFPLAFLWYIPDGLVIPHCNQINTDLDMSFIVRNYI